MGYKNRIFLIAAAGALILASLFIACLLTGPADISLKDILAVFSGDDADEIHRVIILKSRFPEAVTAAVAGAALAVCGLCLQTLFRNPLADPSILGISSGATLAIAIVTFASSGLSLGYLLRPEIQITAACAGSFAVLALLLALSMRIKSNTALLVAGIMTGYLSSAIVTFLQFAGGKESNYNFLMWSHGSFFRTSSDGFFIAFIILCIVGIFLSFLLIKALNMLLLGENYAQNLGLNTKTVRLAIISLCTFLTGIVTAYCGPIAFLGLAVPHIAKQLSGSANRRTLLPLCIFAGSALALFCTLVSKQSFFGSQLPVNVVTSLFGAPIVILAILKSNSLIKKA